MKSAAVINKKSLPLRGNVSVAKECRARRGVFRQLSPGRKEIVIK